MKPTTKGIAFVILIVLVLGGVWFLNLDKEGGLSEASPLPMPTTAESLEAPSMVLEPAPEHSEAEAADLPQDSEEEEKSATERPKTEPANPLQTYRLLITQGYGQNILLEQEIPYESHHNVMDALVLSGAQVETAYGGSFVQALEGLASQGGSKRQDWFFFVNGTFADVGALDYAPLPGDLIWWDYHGWQPGQSTNAVVGAYPAPFLQGYEGQVFPTRIVYAPAAQSQAEILTGALRGLGAKVNLEALSESWVPPRQGPVIVLGVWSDLRKNAHLVKLNEGVLRNGLFSQFEDTTLQLWDDRGQVQKSLEEKGGLIGAVAQTGGDLSPLWLVAALDESDLERAVQLMAENPAALTSCYSLALDGDLVYPLPLRSAQ